MRLSLLESRDGVKTDNDRCVAYDVARDEAYFGPAAFSGHGLVWSLDGGEGADGALLASDVDLDPHGSWIMRCDRIDFPPGGVARLHTHPGPGIRYLLRGAIEIETEGQKTTYAPGGAWFEAGPAPVLAVAAADEATSFVRVLLLPSEWEGRRTIRYVDPADADRPSLQQATVYFDHPVALP